MGWHDEFVDAAAKVELAGRNQNPGLRDMTTDAVADISACRMTLGHSGAAIADFVKERVGSRQDRIRIYFDITGDFVLGQ